MKRYIYSALVAGIVLSTGVLEGFCEDNQDQQTTYVIPIKGMIERGLVYVMRRGFAEAVEQGVDTIVFDMDTPGGRLDAVEEIIRMLIKLPRDVRTVTLVNPDALSAGAMMALATDEIYMAPGSRIGASAVVTITGDIPEGDMKKKMVSATLALVKSAAQHRGHRPEIAEAMMSADFEYKIADEVICPKDELLTLSEFDAMRMVGETNAAPLLAAGKAENLDALLEALGIEKDATKTIEVTSLEQLARIIDGFPISGLLLALGLLGLYIEFKTPGFGFPGIAGLLCLAVWFWGHHIAGLAGMGELVVFFVGVILVLIEIFAIPGFGVVGITGLAMMVASLLMAMVQHYPAEPWYMPPISQVRESVVDFGTALVVTIAAASVLARYLPRTGVFRHLSLSAEMNRADGYEASHGDAGIVGQQGLTVTPLRPAGIAEMGDKRYNVVARGAFIEKDVPIVVAEVHGNRIVVDQSDTPET